MSALVLAVVSALAWAGFDATRKALVKHLEPLALMVWFGLLQAPGFVLWSWLSRDPTTLTWDYALPGGACLTCNVGANVFFFYAVKVSPLSRTIPLLSLTPVFTLLLGAVALDEHPNTTQVLGIVAIVLGALLLNAEVAELKRPWRLLRAAGQRGSLFMSATALLWSISTVMDKLALPHSGVGNHAAIQTAGVALAGLCWLTVTRRLASLALRRRAALLLGVGLVFSVAALGLQLMALQRLFVSLFEAIKRALGGVASVANGRLLFAEPIKPPQVVSVALMAAGVFLVV